MSSDADIIDGQPIPTLDAIDALRAELAPHVVETPAFERRGFGELADARINFKFELLQVGGTFKPRGAFSNMLSLDAHQRKAGVTAISAGNHAVAVAYAAMKLRIPAKVVMIKTANPARVALVRQYGAELMLAESGAEGFALVDRIREEEGRFFVHPFNGYRTVLGTATLGLEWMRQAPSLDAVILPIGGGGLAAGVATAVKLARPDCLVFGVEPEGADGMRQSFAAGHAMKTTSTGTIADSLLPPHTETYSFELCRRHVDELVTVSDDAIRAAMLALFNELKLAPEASCAVATAGLLGPLRARLQGKHVGVLLCGANTDPATLSRHLEAAQAAA